MLSNDNKNGWDYPIIPLSYFNIDGTIHFDLHQTEDEALIKDSIGKVFPDVKWLDHFEVDGVITYKGIFHDLNQFKNLLKLYRIRDTVRAYLKARMRQDYLYFELNKQVLAIGKINFADEIQPLGNVIVSIRASVKNDMKSTISDEEVLYCLIATLTSKD